MSPKQETNEATLRSELDAVTRSLIQSYEEVALLHRISSGMQVTQQPEDFFQRITHDLRMVLNVQQLWVFLKPEEDASEIRLAASDGPLNIDTSQANLLWKRTSEKSESPMGVLIESSLSDHETLASVAIKRNDNVMGIIVAVNKNEHQPFDSIDIKMLTSVASESAVYLENFTLYQDLQDLMMGSLKALTNSIDAKDPYTCGHSERVAVISRWLGQQIGLDEKKIRDAYLGGLLHDVGKIGISESILTKLGKLTEQEFSEIKKHPEIGAKILKDIKPLREVNKAVLTHHERLNGSGYPHNLTDDEIPMIGKIVGLADSFDAMINNRCYRAAFSLSEVLEEIHRCRDTHYDPKLVDLMTPENIESLLTELEEIPANPENLSELYATQTLS